MRVVVASLGVGLLAVVGPARAADQVINLPECAAVSTEDVRAMAEASFVKRRYNIEENTPTLIMAELDDKRVEVLIEPQKVIVRWKEGYAGKNDLWLRNLKTDILWLMVE
jgi:hypothetical protein